MNTTLANKPAAPNAGIASQLTIAHHLPGVGEPERLGERVRTMIFSKCAACGLIIIVVGCGNPAKTNKPLPLVEPGRVSLVDEVYGLSQGLATDGFNFTVRGWLVAEEDGSGYQLYNAAWDPFDPKTKEGIPSISLKFEEQPANYWVGQYTNVSGNVVTEALPGGGRTVSLEGARVVSTRSKSGQVIPYRSNQAQHPDASDG